MGLRAKVPPPLGLLCMADIGDFCHSPERAVLILPGPWLCAGRLKCRAILSRRKITSFCADFLVERRGFEPDLRGAGGRSPEGGAAPGPARLNSEGAPPSLAETVRERLIEPEADASSGRAPQGLVGVGFALQRSGVRIPQNSTTFPRLAAASRSAKSFRPSPRKASVSPIAALEPSTYNSRRHSLNRR
jgi:hypothetical protein